MVVILAAILAVILAIILVTILSAICSIIHPVVYLCYKLIMVGSKYIKSHLTCFKSYISENVSYLSEYPTHFKGITNKKTEFHSVKFIFQSKLLTTLMPFFKVICNYYLQHKCYITNDMVFCAVGDLLGGRLGSLSNIIQLSIKTLPYLFWFTSCCMFM